MLINHCMENFYLKNLDPHELFLKIAGVDTFEWAKQSSKNVTLEFILLSDHRNAAW